MATMIKNASPRPILTGIRDESGRALPVIREQIPQHLPLFYIQTQRGPIDPQLVSGGDMLEMYGRKSFEERSKYFSHQTMGVTTCNGAGNAVFIKRVLADNAARAGMVFFLELVADDVPQYQRDPDGEVIRDPSGVKLIDGSVTVDGYKMRWVVEPVSDINNLRGEFKTNGTLAGRAGETAQRFPIFAFGMYYGDYGNNIGIRFSFPGPATSDPADLSLVESERAMIYRAQWVERDDAFSLPRTTYSMNAEPFVDFTLKEGVVNPKTDQELAIGRIKSDYENIEPTSGFIPKHGPVQDMHIYQENIEEILEMLFEKEVAAGGPVVDKHQLNIFNCLDYNGNDHYSFVLDASSATMSSSTVHYGQGGSDGDVNEAVLDELVREECLNNWENIDYPLLDSARYPLSVVYDTGFTLETKKAIINVLAYRKDISVGICTQDVLNRPNSISEETSVMTALRAYARLIPESTIHGTPVCRMVCIGHVGRKQYSNYKYKVPLIHDLIEKRAKYMGAGEGRYKTRFAYDVAPANRVETMSEINHPWKPEIVRSRDWELGLNWVQFADRQSLFYPALQTIYDDDTSVLNSDINMLIAVDVVKQSEEVWRRMTGNTTYTNEQFIERCNRELLTLVEGRYDNRVTIVPNTYFTEADEARGYSWTMDVAVYANNMRTVGIINVITRRSSDLD